jgi:dihydrofolate reductase
MMIRAILACDEKWGIGKAGTLPWPHNPADLKWFKECTLNSTVVMGKATWDDPDMPKPMPRRHNVIVSSTMRENSHERIEVVRPDIYKSRCVTMSKTDDVWIIGGARLITDSLDIIDEIWLSQIKGTYDCDTFLPVTLIQELFTLTSSQREGELYIDKWSRR